MACPPSERLIDFVDGRLDDAGQREVEAHIDVCESCRKAMGMIVRGEPPAWSLGRYRIDGVLGAGGMGIVYRGWDPSLARPVAVKVVRTGDDGSLRSRLAREAQSLARLNHPNVCQVYDVGNDDSELWIAMELVDGVTLRVWLAGQRSREEILEVLTAAGHGLAAAHRAGLVHRDVKPENVLVDRPGRAVVTDFGLARTASAASSTHTSVLAGTPAYMAPEQLDGTPADARTDQYAFAVMVHEALTGARPRPRNVASAALPNPLRAILSRALADDPAQRYPSLPALLDAIAKAKPSARRWPILAGAAVLVGGGAVAVSFIVSSRSPEDASEPIALGEPPPIREPIREPIHAPTATVDAGEIVVDATVQQPPAAPRPKTVAATRPEALRDAGVDASVAAVTPAKRVSDRDLPVPRLGETVNKKNLLGKRITTLAEAEAEFTHGLCQLPTMPKVNEYSQPVDWGKVTRVADVVAKHTKHGATDLRLYEIAGQRKRYLIDSHWGAALHGELGAKVGDVVAICPRGDVNDEYELPEGWQGPITRHHVVVRVGGPPDRRGLSLISWSNINATNTDHTWPYGDRMLIYGRTGGQLNSGKYMMSGWQLEVDAATKNPLDLHRGAWIVVEKPRWEPYGKSRDGTERTIVVLHAAEMYATLFPPAP